LIVALGVSTSFSLSRISFRCPPEAVSLASRLLVLALVSEDIWIVRLKEGDKSLRELRGCHDIHYIFGASRLRLVRLEQKRSMPAGQSSLLGLEKGRRSSKDPDKE
jgi:hypothetical protein